MATFDQSAHARTVKRMRGGNGSDEQLDGLVIAQVSMPRSQKERFAAAAKAHSISLSALFRLAADEYLRTHGWE
jgi:hypothetical protein